MPKKMLFNARQLEECRAAIIENNELLEYDIETTSREQNRNNIYRGYIVQVEPSIQAAFVEYGTNRHGFLPFREIHPDFYSRKPKDGVRHPSIDQVMRKGQQVVVQVVREEVDHKGAALTTYCTLPGRYLVLMPRSDNSGISRKIEDPGERKSLRNIMKSIKPPEGFGYIIRTAGLGKSESEISRDLDIMVRLWKSIQKAAKRGPRVGLIFQDADIIQRMIRDYYDQDVDEIWIDDPDSFDRAHTYFSAVMPNVDNVVKLYEDAVPLFTANGIEDQLQMIYERQVPLPSGGSIVIDSTEALVAIDVNSGKTQSDNTEETAFKTNCEAAAEIARQIRLRDIGGLVVIDFIGMRMTKHMRGVERAMREAVKEDKARIRLGRLNTTFGLLTLSRQRIRDRKELAHFVTCPGCRGMGKYPNVETNALAAYRHLYHLAMQEKFDKISASLPREVAFYLLNYKRKRLSAIEEEYDVQVSIIPKEGIVVDFERDISVQVRRSGEPKKRKERSPIQLPYERLSNESPTEPQREPVNEAAQVDEPKRLQDERPQTSERVQQNERQAPLPEFPAPASFEDTAEAYYADGWDQVAKEAKGKQGPSCAPWFLQHLSPVNDAPSLEELKAQFIAPQEPEVAEPSNANKGKDTKPKQAKAEAPKTKGSKPKQDTQAKQPKQGTQPKQPKQTAAQAPTETQGPSEEDLFAQFGLKDDTLRKSVIATPEPAPKPAAAATSAPAPAATAPAPAPKSTPKPAMPGPFGRLPMHRRHSTRSVSTKNSPHIRVDETPSRHKLGAMEPEASKDGKGGIWSAADLAKIRQAAEEEHRKLTRWKRPAEGEAEATQPSGFGPPQPNGQREEPKPEVTVTSPDATESNNQRKVLKRPAPAAEPAAAEPAAATPAPTPKGKDKAAPNGKSKKPPRRPRWSDEEVELLQSLCHLPLLEAKEAFEAEGYNRSLSAFRNRYYTLRGN